jgi:dTDP-4-amino-4,6-dideoxygalactose transaminase
MSVVGSVPFSDLGWQWRQIRAAALPELARLFEAGAFCLGPWTERFEAEIAEYLGVAHAVAVNSGTSALHLAVKVAGIGRGDKVLVPAHTFIGTVWGLLYEGATPVLCDVDPATGTIDAADAARRLEPGVKAILPVHLYGQPADMTSVRSLAEAQGLTVIEDAAQAIGARHGGQRVGGIGRVAGFSFYPGKNLGGAGEGGLVATNDASLARHVRSLREHGQSERYVHAELGYNYRMDGIQALILGHKLKLLDGWTEERRALASRYDAALRDLPVQAPAAIHGEHVYHLYVVLTPLRDALRRALAEAGIQTGLHYPVPLHRQPCLNALTIPRDSFPVADRFAAQGLSLPLFPGLKRRQQDRVIAALRGFFDRPESTR